MPAPSTTLVTSFMPTHSPLKRDRAIAVQAEVEHVLRVGGRQHGMPISASAVSELLGTVDDLATESSPTRTTAPPAGAAPPRLAWRSASVARSRPGALPYQMPTTPSQVGGATEDASWEPCTALAAELLVDAGLEDDAVLVEQLPLPGELEVVAGRAVTPRSRR